MTTSKTRRWTHAVITEAAALELQLPWARGSRRAAMIVRRNPEGKPAPRAEAMNAPAPGSATH